MGALWSGQQVGGQTLSPSDDKQMNSEKRMPPSSSSASKVSGHHGPSCLSLPPYPGGY